MAIFPKPPEGAYVPSNCYPASIEIYSWIILVQNYSTPVSKAKMQNGFEYVNLLCELFNSSFPDKPYEGAAFLSLLTIIAFLSLLFATFPEGSIGKVVQKHYAKHLGLVQNSSPIDYSWLNLTQ